MYIALELVVIALLITISALCSGLNVAIMSLNPSELRRKAKTGNSQAKRLVSLRDNVHLSLSAILLTNVAMISATSLMLSRHLGGLIAGLVSTLVIVVFGEIIPQALFTRRALAFSSRFAWLLKSMVVVTYPVSKPLQLLLDRWFGKEDQKLHSRLELGLMMGEHLQHGKSELDEDEVEIMQGALLMSTKRVSDIMTPIKSVYSLAPSSKLDGKKIRQMIAKGHSRVPVISKDRKQCLGIFILKDHVDVNFNDQGHLVNGLSLHTAKVVGSKTALDTLFRKFIGSKTHMMMVKRNSKIVGIVTIEDLLEEIIGHEIEDESDR